MSVEILGNKILDICKDDSMPYKDNKERLFKLFHEVDAKDIENTEEMEALITLHRELSKIKNRKASYLENELGRLKLVSLPFRIRAVDDAIPEHVETLEEDVSTDSRIAIQLSSQLLRYGKEIISSKPNKTKRYTKRVQEALRLLNELQEIYDIKGIKEIFQSKINAKDKDLQFFALYGLEIYYAHESADELTDEEEKQLDTILETTKSRDNAYTCCKILSNSGKVDDLTAMFKMDNWKSRNWD